MPFTCECIFILKRITGEYVAHFSYIDISLYKMAMAANVSFLALKGPRMVENCNWFEKWSQKIFLALHLMAGGKYCVVLAWYDAWRAL